MNKNSMQHHRAAAKAFVHGVTKTEFIRNYTVHGKGPGDYEKRTLELTLGFNKNRKSKRPKVAGKKFIRNTVEIEESSPLSMKPSLVKLN